MAQDGEPALPFYSHQCPLESLTQPDCQAELDDQTQSDSFVPLDGHDPDNKAQPDTQTKPDINTKPAKDPPSRQLYAKQILPLPDPPDSVPQPEQQLNVAGEVDPEAQPLPPDKPDPLPPPWTGFSICNSVLFCPLGIVALFCSFMVKRSHRRGKYSKSRLYSKIAMWLNGISFVGIFLLAFLLAVFIN